LFAEPGREGFDRVTARLADDVADEKQFHGTNLTAKRENTRKKRIPTGKRKDKGWERGRGRTR
jgi:hypothetical protein